MHQRWIQPRLITFLLCCATPLSVAGDGPTAQKQKVTEHQAAKPFTIAVLPDTQFYCDCRLKLSAKWGNGDLRRYFFAQTKWVRDNQKRLNITFLVHEGDIVQADAPEEWSIAKEAMSVLDGQVPYCMCLGNHDMGFEKADNKYGGNIGVNRTTHFNTYFPRDKFAKRREFGGTFDPDRHDNSWYHFETAGMKFLIVSLECKPRDEVLDWANKIVSKHPDHRVIILTHAYLNPKKSRNTAGGVKAKGNTGEQTWQKFVKKHENIFMVLCGHHSGEAVRTDVGDHGNQVHQILCDYQGMNNGGESWLRYMTFIPESNKISVSTYSPALNKFRNGPSSRFDLDYPMTLLPKAKAANVVEKDHTVKALADRVRAHVKSEPLRFPNQHWVRGAYYAGLMAMYESTLDRAYLDDCMEWGKNVSWQINEQGGGPYESGAYPLVCGQIWYGCYRAKKDELMIQPTLAFLEDPKVENPVSAPGKWYLENTGHRFVDGLFTAPPTLAMLYQMTGDEKYVDWMDACFWDVHGEIFDHDAGLFYRDARSKPRKTKNGKKVLWSRGNGWAFGGLARILKVLPSEHPSYQKYKSLFIQMAESLAKRQQVDGFWRSNLDDPEQYPMKESSGTGFFCYGITWGINNGILDKDRFLPVARKAWTALASVVNDDGKVGWSQPAGGGPGKVAEADTSKFGTGIFLLAASEIHLLFKNKEHKQYDVCVYGGTPGGITAAISAAREGASVVLLEQTRHVGGLTTSGLNRDECNHLDRQTLGGLCEQFLEEAVKRSNGRWTEGNSRTWQSGIAERVFLEMLKEAGVDVRYEQLLDQVKKDGTRITELRVQGGEIYRANVFIDATYEGDLMAKAGVSYSVGRESAEHYGESIAGVRYLDDKVAISPFDDEGNLLFGVMPGKPPEAGSASEVPICYNVRLNITTDEANRVPIEKPSSYDPMQHELLARALEAGLLKNLSSIIGIYPMGESSKRELNNRQFSIVSMSIPGAQTSWAEASFKEREAIHQQYRDYTHGMLWFLKTDPRVPKHIRDEMAAYGFCKDEWVDNDHWPYYLYIRAARRMQGEVVLTQADVIKAVDKEDVIHVGSHFIDCHHAARYAVDSGHIINEGRIWKQGARFDIPYRAITPKTGECSNVLVPVCASATHVAFCTIRLEPTWMHLGEVAGIAAAMAATSGKSVQAIDIESLQARLLELGIPLEHPEGPMAYEKHGKPKTFAPDDVVKAFFAGADKDGDGMASRSEWDSARPTWKWLFDHIDKDKNGQLDRAEYKAWQTYKKEHPGWHTSLQDSHNQGSVKQRN
jgi:rhamnogalacturonyl hydrolase YesR